MEISIASNAPQQCRNRTNSNDRRNELLPFSWQRGRNKALELEKREEAKNSIQSGLSIPAINWILANNNRNREFI